MHECIKQAEESTMAAGCEFNTKPYRHWHAAMMNNVQRGNLTLFFAQNKEYLRNKMGYGFPLYKTLSTNVYKLYS